MSRQTGPQPHAVGGSSNRSGVATRQPSGAIMRSPYLKGISYDSAWQMQAQDFAAESPYVSVMRQFLNTNSPGTGVADWNANASGFQQNVDTYYNAGIPIIFCLNDKSAALGAPGVAGSYVQACMDIVTRWPNLYALEIQNEINYGGWTTGLYAQYIKAVHDALRGISVGAINSNVPILFANLDSAKFADSDAFFSNTSQGAAAVTYADAVGFHGYKLLGDWDADAGPAWNYGATTSWAGVPAKEVSAGLNSWMTSFKTSYGNIQPLDGSGYAFMCTEIGIQVVRASNSDAAGVVTAVQGALGSGPPAGTYYYMLVNLDSQGANPGPRLGSGLSETISVVVDGNHSVNLTWPTTINTGGTAAWDIWRMPSSDARTCYSPSTSLGAPYDIGSGFKYGWIARVNNGGGANSFTDTVVTCSQVPQASGGGASPGYFGDLTPRGDASGFGGMYGEGWYARQIPRIVAEYRKAKANAVCIYTGVGYWNQSRGVFDPNYINHSCMRDQSVSGSTTSARVDTSVWTAFKNVPL